MSVPKDRPQPGPDVRIWGLATSGGRRPAGPSPDARGVAWSLDHSGHGQRQRYNPRRSAVTSAHAGTGCAPRIRSSRSNAVTSSGGGGSGGGHDQSAGPGDRSGLTSTICRTSLYAALSSR